MHLSEAVVGTARLSFAIVPGTVTIPTRDADDDGEVQSLYAKYGGKTLDELEAARAAAAEVDDDDQPAVTS